MQRPAAVDSLLSCSATQLAKLIRDGDTSSREIVDAHIEQIETVNPTINAVVKTRYDLARREADLADQQLQSDASDLPLFFGVPCTIKESFAVRGMPHSAGLVARRHVIAQDDAPTVARLREAGAIILGVTNTSELCMWMESNNSVYGRTNNPYDPTRIVGGSSGGEGAIVAAGGSPLGLGADIGGSIRLPAFFNGVFGHKPSGGLVPGTGQYPVAVNQAARYLSTGPIARRAEDLLPALHILAGPDGLDTQTEEMPIGDVSRVRLKGLRVLNVAENGVQSVSADMQRAQQGVARWLQDAGAEVEDASIDGLKDSVEIWASMLSAAGGPAFGEFLGDGRPINALSELLWFALGRSDHTLPALMLALMEKLPELTPQRTQAFVDKGKKLQKDLEDALAGGAIMLFPPYTRVAPKHGHPLFTPFDWVYCGIMNMMQLPSTQVPLGLDDDGLPLGVQIIAAHKNDHITLAVARALEEAFGGWVPPAL